MLFYLLCHHDKTLKIRGFEISKTEKGIIIIVYVILCIFIQVACCFFNLFCIIKIYTKKVKPGLEIY